MRFPILVFLAFILLPASLSAFSASNGIIDVNYGFESDIGDWNVNSADGIELDFVDMEMPSGTWSNGTIEANIAVLFIEISEDETSTTSQQTSTTQQPSSGPPYCRYYSRSDVCDKTQYCPTAFLNVFDTKKCCSTQCQSIPKEDLNKEVIFLAYRTYSPSIEESETETVLEQIEFYPDKKLKRIATAKDVKFSRSLEGISVFTTSEIIEYIYTMTVVAENIGAKKITSLELIESIPKEIVKNVSDISSDYAFAIIKADPIIKFSLGALNPGEKASIIYSFSRTVEAC